METLKAIIQYKLPMNKGNKNNLYSVSVGGGTGPSGGWGRSKEVGSELGEGQDPQGEWGAFERLSFGMKGAA